jgi:hypothetical protein
VRHRGGGPGGRGDRRVVPRPGSSPAPGVPVPAVRRRGPAVGGGGVRRAVPVSHPACAGRVERLSTATGRSARARSIFDGPIPSPRGATGGTSRRPDRVPVTRRDGRLRGLGERASSSRHLGRRHARP